MGDDADELLLEPIELDRLGHVQRQRHGSGEGTALVLERRRAHAQVNRAAGARMTNGHVDRAQDLTSERAQQRELVDLERLAVGAHRAKALAEHLHRQRSPSGDVHEPEQAQRRWVGEREPPGAITHEDGIDHVVEDRAQRCLGLLPLRDLPQLRGVELCILERDAGLVGEELGHRHPVLGECRRDEIVLEVDDPEQGRVADDRKAGDRLRPLRRDVRISRMGVGNARIADEQPLARADHLLDDGRRHTADRTSRALDRRATARDREEHRSPRACLLREESRQSAKKSPPRGLVREHLRELEQRAPHRGRGGAAGRRGCSVEELLRRRHVEAACEIVVQLRRGLVTILRELLEELRHDVRDGARRMEGGRPHGLGEMALRPPEHVVLLTGSQPREHLDEDHADGVEVRAPVERPVEPTALLRRHVRRRSLDRVARGVVSSLRSRRRDPEPRELDLTGASVEVHVLGLEVPMDEALAMNALEARGQPRRDPQREPDLHRSAHRLPQRNAAEIFEHERRATFERAHLHRMKRD